MTLALTPRQAAETRTRLLEEIHDHRRAERRARRALERLEADCARVGIRLIREPRQTLEQGESDVSRTDPDAR